MQTINLNKEEQRERQEVNVTLRRKSLQSKVKRKKLQLPSQT